jgi:energy-coupling factor transporter ATP-binding protein EcfA2
MLVFPSFSCRNYNNSVLVPFTSILVVVVHMMTTSMNSQPAANALQPLPPPRPVSTRSQSDNCNNILVYVVFGRPGAGKSTVAERAAGLINSSRRECKQQRQRSSSTTMIGTDRHSRDELMEGFCLALDLDVCVPDWMRENFGRGMYPTLAERTAFASEACDYVEKHLKVGSDASIGNNECLASCIVSFSFVNTDLRDVFRSRFPTATWILIDTTEEEAAKRIRERENHFYKGSNPVGQAGREATNQGSGDDIDNSEWNFAPVDFPHVILRGDASIEENAQTVAQEILTNVRNRATQENQ